MRNRLGVTPVADQVAQCAAADLTITELAKRVPCSRGYAYRMVQERRLPHRREKLYVRHQLQTAEDWRAFRAALRSESSRAVAARFGVSTRTICQWRQDLIGRPRPARTVPTPTTYRCECGGLASAPGPCQHRAAA